MLIAGWLVLIPVIALIAVGAGLLIGGGVARKRNPDAGNGLLVAGGVVAGIGLVPLAIGTLLFAA
jgi:hypothetical protein